MQERPTQLRKHKVALEDGDYYVVQVSAMFCNGFHVYKYAGKNRYGEVEVVKISPNMEWFKTLDEAKEFIASEKFFSRVLR